jgi:hypothetical protein
MQVNFVNEAPSLHLLALRLSFSKDYIECYTHLQKSRDESPASKIYFPKVQLTLGINWDLIFRLVRAMHFV